MKKTPLTASMFYQYDFCPHWIWFDHFGDKRKKGQVGELMEKLLEQGVAHEEEYIADQDVVEIPYGAHEDSAAATLTLMQQGVEAIYQGVLHAEINGRMWTGKPDLLVKKKGESSLGNWHYVPIDIKSSHYLKPVQKMQLSFYARLLEEVQGKFPLYAAILNIDHEEIGFKPKPFQKKFTQRLAEIERIIEGEKPPLVFTRTCLQGPWGKQCKAQAEEANDICLLYNVSRRALSALRDEGITTVDDAALMTPSELPKIPYMNPKALERMKLQAESLTHNEIRIVRTPSIPEADLVLHFDIEGDPLLGVEYLFGFLNEKTEEYTMFLAEQPEEEEQMWHDFLQWLTTLPENYIVFHYAPYERVRMQQMAEKYGGSKELDHFIERLFDLFDEVKSCLVLPLYFYSIKDICKHLGFSWRHKKAGGAQSIFWYEEWVSSGDRSILNDIIQYNEDDVKATKYLKQWLENKTAEGESRYGT